jgi:hypothetical protein
MIPTLTTKDENNENRSTVVAVGEGRDAGLAFGFRSTTHSMSHRRKEPSFRLRN